MSDGTRIEWATWNPVTGCMPISVGCEHCYAKRMARLLAGRYGYPEGDGFAVTVHEDKLRLPNHWRKPRKIFVCSMGDLFHKDVTTETIRLIWSVMALPRMRRHTFWVLTKRPNRLAEWLAEWKSYKPWKEPEDNYAVLPNAWLGVTAENQACYDERWPILARIPAAKRFVSVEPMLGPVNIVREGRLPDWIICGAEQGPGARWMRWVWAMNLYNQCKAAGIPFFFKRNSAGNYLLDGLPRQEYPK